MKKGDFKLKAGDCWKTTVIISTVETTWLNKIVLREIISKAINEYFENRKETIIKYK